MSCLQQLTLLFCWVSVSLAQSKNGVLVPETTTRFHFTHDFVPDDTFQGQRCVMTGGPELEYEADSPGQLFQSCFGGAMSATTRGTAGSVFLQFTGISAAAVSALGNESSLRKLYNMSHDLLPFTPFNEFLIADEQVDGLLLQPMLDSQLQPLLNLSYSDASVNATALAELPVTDGPNYFLVRFALMPPTPANLSLTGIELRNELLTNSLVLIKLYVMVSPSTTPIVHWEVMGASSETLHDTEGFLQYHLGGNVPGNVWAIGVAACVIGVIALVNCLMLGCILLKWRSRSKLSNK
jgi:hypothetical protein